MAWGRISNSGVLKRRVEVFNERLELSVVVVPFGWRCEQRSVGSIAAARQKLDYVRPMLHGVLVRSSQVGERGLNW